MDFDAPRPAFFDGFDSDPPRARAEFYQYLVRFMAACPPREFRWAPPSSRPDLIHDLYIHFTKDDFRKLRQFDPIESFKKWFFRSIRNFLIDEARRESARTRSTISIDSAPDGQPAIEIPAPSPPRTDAIDVERALIQARECMSRQDLEDRIVLECTADGLKPLEICRLLGWPRERNVAVSELLRTARRRLLKCMSDHGIDPRALFRPSPDGGFGGRPAHEH